MKFKAKLNAKFYIVSALLLGIVVLGWYGIYFLNANEILMEDNIPMDDTTKLFFSVVMCAVVLSWTFSLLALVRQIILGQAFSLDYEGIHHTSTAINVLAFIFVVPVKNIPYNAIEKFCEENGTLTLFIDKKKIDAFMIFRPLVRKRYHLFSGFTAENRERIKSELSRYIQAEI